MTAEALLPESNDPAADQDDPIGTTLDTLEDVLDAMRERLPDIPGWEFFEGVLTALLCTRRAIEVDEWLPEALNCDPDELFASPSERTRFMMGWMEREAQVRAALQAPIESLDDERALNPAVIDWRGLLASLPEADRATALKEDGFAPALGQMWALGFMFVVDGWPDDWAPPRDKEIAADIEDAVDCIAELTQDDTGQPMLNLYDPDQPTSVSEARAEAFGEALWAVYDLYAIAASLGPRTPPARRDEAKVGRNDPCPCGSGKKYKKCCGA